MFHEQCLGISAKYKVVCGLDLDLTDGCVLIKSFLLLLFAGSHIVKPIKSTKSLFVSFNWLFLRASFYLQGVVEQVINLIISHTE